MKRPTIKDVAKEASVSIATVSRILNNGTGYSDKTRQHVLNTIERLGYSPNAIARGLISKQSNTIGVLFPDVSGLISAEILQGIEEAAHAQEFSVIVCKTDSDGKKTMDNLRLLHEKQVEGIIFTSQMLTNEYASFIEKMGVPVITVSSYSEKEGIPAVKVDDEAAACDAVRYLISQQHTQIGMISGPPTDPLAGTPRINGYKRALEEAGIEYDESKVAWDSGFYFEHGEIAFSKLHELHPQLTALFAASDELGVSAISCAYDLGLRVPDDLSIIGYDGTRLAKMSNPPLTTVSQGFEEMGRKSAELLFESIETGEPSPGAAIQHRIVERKSVKKK
ncbi:LacI family transcriptional regulator [Jeotgalibacillus sp. S-D1]|uniref:LacI family DNA-binding transcriptional regulator n=1 Tax=Jeotgalibacillus sp. S-D1 TaxID=2552189 RepID=UPI00105A8632|nr:substrate-binding domain-containing protein [Jeotgalibacillus sp. S-D1]TDL31933.1 LacI family transcriptional regulator [Jeotgalibacillus sp. S-D1]